MAAIFQALTKGGGQCMAMPDVCLTPAPPAPPVPVPYPNTGMANQAKNTTKKVKIMGKEVVTKNSEIPRSMGDEAGVNKGVVSGMNMSKVLFKKGSSKVKLQGHDCIHLCSITGHNGSNANMPSGCVLKSDQNKVILAP
jgi:hypothetical protein